MSDINGIITCSPISLPEDQWEDAAINACRINPCNMPAIGMALITSMILEPQHIAVLTQKYWRSGKVDLSVQFLDNPPADLRAKILLHMNAWNKMADIRFRETAGQGQVRIARAQGGYWSYLGTDILMVPAGKPTMNLEGFTMNTPDGEFYRVVRHETGHTLGCPHEHMRRELVNLLDPAKTIDYFSRTQGWSKSQVIQQILTPLEEGSLISTERADDDSIMCYQIPGVCTKSGAPIPGGRDIDPSDYEFMAKIYPLPVQPPPPPPPPAGGDPDTMILAAGGREIARYKLTK